MRCNRMTRPPMGSLLAVTLVLGGCSLTADEGPTVDYRDAESTKSLEVPPDLTTPKSSVGLSVDGGGTGGSGGSGGSATASTGISSGGSGVDGAGSGGVLPEFDNVRFVRAGGSSWLEVEDAAPDAVWPRVERFIRAQGLTIEQRKPALGVIETGWAERFDGPESGGLTGFFDSILGGTSDNLRERYTIRLERMDDGGTRIFVAHRLAQEIDAAGNTRQSADFEWVRRRGDPSMEAEMARRLLVHLGLSGERSEAIIADVEEAVGGAVRYAQNGGAARVMVDDPNRRRVFARAGDALTRIGAEVHSAKSDRGVYELDWRPPKGSVDNGGLFGLFGSDEPKTRRLQLQLSRESGGTRIRAADESGTPRSGDVHRALLRELAVAMGANEDQVRAASSDNNDGSDGGDSGGGDRWGQDRPQSW